MPEEVVSTLLVQHQLKSISYVILTGNPPISRVLVLGDQSPKTLLKRLKYDEKSFNPPAPNF